MERKKLNMVSFFSGCGGLDYGFHNDKFNILLATDCWGDAVKSFKLNYPEVKVLEKPIEQIEEKEIFEVIGKKKIDLLIGGPPCQCFTRLNNNQLIKQSEAKKEDGRRVLSKIYIQMVKLLQPKVVLMENVKDMLIRKNISGDFYRDIIVEEFRKIGYSVYFKIVSMEKYTVPEKRKRVIFFATRLRKLIKILDKNPNYAFPEESDKVVCVKEALAKLENTKKLQNHYFVENERETSIRIKNIPQGGYYEDLPEKLKTKKIRNGEEVVVKRYGSYLRRLHPEKPSYTITKNYLIHPFEDRYLSNREKAVVHGFPVDYKFFGCEGSVCQQIANAVPPSFSKILAQKVFNMLNS